MKIINLNYEDVFNGSLILINSKYPIREKYYKKKSLVPVDIEHYNILLEFKTATVLAHIIDDLRARDMIIPVSGYRSKDEQGKIYSASLMENGEEFTRNYVALPGHSEHQLGLAIDLGKKQEYIDFIRPEFPYEGIYNEFRQRAIKYGFVERYAKDKEKITGISGEPWHFRYVGYPHSKIMHDKDLCLEEYIDFLKTYPYNKQHLKINVDKQPVEIFYIPILSTDKLSIGLPKDKLYQVSGNNIDGCIVTLWR